MRSSWCASALCVVLVACGTPAADDAGLDAGAPDGSPDDPDASQPDAGTSDAGPSDAGPDPSFDRAYEPDDDPDLLNPERGIYYWSPDSSDPHTLVGEWLYLGDECDRDLVWAGDTSATSPVLRAYAARLVAHRAAGRKVIFRPRYDVPSNAGLGRCGTFHADDWDRQLAHVDAIAAMLGEHRDVIAFVEAGYLGRWGEWNHSGFDASSAPFLVDPVQRRALAAHAIDRYRAAGLERDVGLRRPVFARELLAEHPATAGGVALYNDCFMTNDSDSGTYSNFESGNASNFASSAEAIAWAEIHTLDAPFGGETCPVASSRWESCDNMVGPASEPARLHMSYLHGAWADTARATWEAGGCYDEIKRRLGYRFEVRSVEWNEAVAPATPTRVRVEIENTGWARMHGSRRAYLTLRGPSLLVVANTSVAGASVLVPSSSSGDVVADWAPGETATFEVVFGTPPNGDYELGLIIPDADRDDLVDYAVRIASLREGAPLFDTSTGINDLGVVLSITD